MEYTPGRCIWKIKAKEDYLGLKMPFGFHIEVNRDAQDEICLQKKQILCSQMG